MRHRSLAPALFYAALAASPAIAQNANKDATIRTTIIIRSKAGDCPPGFTIFQMEGHKKLPPDPKICFVRAPKPANQ